MKKFIVTALLTIFVLTAEAQYKTYIVKFRHKGSTTFTLNNPSAYLSQRAIDRRTRYNIAIDSTDLPVPLNFLDSIRAAGVDTIINVSKWLNQVSVRTSDPNEMASISNYSFVQSVVPIAPRFGNTGGKFDNTDIDPNTSRVAADYFNYGNSFTQINMHNGQFLHNIGLRGQGMVMGLLDAGFFNYTTLRSFDSANVNGQVLSTYDFVLRQPSVIEDNSHGMQVFSVIAANIPGTFVGSAPKANYHLFRTEEVATEYPVEEHNWVCGAERADSAGADVIQSSVGYSTFDDPFFDHTYAQMNGNTTMAAQGADLGAKKGMLIFNSAGNDGSNSWKFISTPADGDSVVAVGSVTAAGAPSNFSSFGPSSDGQIKPDVASMGSGTTVQNTNNTIGTNNGTSFATPNMSGLTTCLWQGFPEFNNMKIVDALRRAGNRFSNPDDRVGYGIPNMKTAFGKLVHDFSTATATIVNCRVTINWTSKDVNIMRYEIDRKAPGEPGFSEVGEKAATGGSVLSTRNYSFSDTLINVQAGTISYQIRQIIDTALATATSVAIDTIDIALNTSACSITTGIDPVDPSVTIFQLMPNPSYGEVNVKLGTANPISNLRIRITDIKGRTVLSFEKSKGAGTATFTLPIYRLAKGKYVVTIYDKQKRMGSKELIRL